MSIIIYCNSCFEVKSKNKRKYFITSCSHAFCDVCLSNDRNFCKLCNRQCRVLEISKDLPPGVQIMFDTGSIQKLAENIRKVNSFQANQTRMYQEKMKPKIDQFPKYKDYLQKIHNANKNYMEVLKQEKIIMERLKVAYLTKHITSDLYSLSGRLTSNNGSSPASQPSSREGSVGSVSSSRSGRTIIEVTSRPPSREGSVISNHSSQSRTSLLFNNSPRTPLAPHNRIYSTPSPVARSQAPLLSSLMQKYNYSNLSNQPSTPSYLKAPSGPASNVSPSNSSGSRSYSNEVMSRVSIPAKEIVRKPQVNSQKGPQFRSMFTPSTRGNLLENTLRQMNAQSQMKYQAMRRQQAKI